MEIGQPWPASKPLVRTIIAALAACAPGRGSIHGMAWIPWWTDWPSTECQEGWNSTSSIRFPYRSWVRRTGGWALASSARCRYAGDPSRAPSVSSGFSAQSPASRRTASTSGRFVENAS